VAGNPTNTLVSIKLTDEQIAGPGAGVLAEDVENPPP
jgi:hypothetical protein